MNASDSDPRLLAAVEAYLAAMEGGDTPGQAEWLARYPDLTQELKPCLAAIDFIHRPGPGSAPVAAGRTLGDFRILREVGRGGMGVVYEAEQISLGRRVALKVLPFAAVLDPTHLQRFRNEAQAAAHLHHTHIVPVHAVGVERGVHYYAMQFIEGQSLAEVVCELKALRGGPRTPSTSPLLRITGGKTSETPEYCRAVARLGIQAAEALDHAHAQGIVHRDIKPANLMLDAAGHLWVTDFGLARGRADPGLTVTGGLIGTARYMSPEQARGEPADHRADVYALGVTLFEMLTLEPAFPGEEPHAVLRAVVEREPPSPRARNRAVPPALDTIVGKACAKEPRERYATAGEMAGDLRRFLEDRPILARRPSLLDRAAKWARRHRAVVVAGVGFLVLAVLVLAGAILLVAREQRSTARALAAAERNFEWAMDAVDAMLLELAGEDLADVPYMTPVRERLLKRAAAFYESFLAAHGEDPALRLQTARIHRRAGEVLALLGREAESSAAARSGEAVLARLQDDANVRRERALLHGLLGELRLAADNPERAFSEAHRSLDLWRAVADETGRPEDREGLAEAHRSLAHLTSLCGRHGDAVAAARDAVAVLEGVVTRHASAERDMMLAKLHIGLARLVKYEGPVESERALRRALDLVPAERMDTPARSARADALGELGFVLGHAGRLDEGGASYAEAASILGELTDLFPHVPAYRDRLARAYHGHSLVFVIGNRVREAAPLMAKAAAIHEVLLERFPTRRHRYRLTVYLRNLGYFLRLENRAADALPLYARCLSILDQLEAEGAPDRRSQERTTFFRVAGTNAYLGVAPEVPNYTGDRAEMLYYLGSTLIELDRPLEALAVMERRMAIDPASEEAVKDVAAMHLFWEGLSGLDPARGLALAEQAVAMNPEHAQCWGVLALGRLRACDASGAIEAVDRALELGQDRYVLLTRALACQMAGDAAGAGHARDAGLAWLERNDDNWVARFLRREVEEALGKDG